MPINMKYDRLTPYAEDMYQKFLDNQDKFSPIQQREVEKAAGIIQCSQEIMDTQELCLEALLARVGLKC